MGMFESFESKKSHQAIDEELYNCLFADDAQYFRAMSDMESISWIYSGRIPEIDKLESWAKDESIESRIRFLSLYTALKRNIKIDEKIYFGTILEVPMNNGCDILAFYSDKRARYYNYAGASTVYENGNTRVDLAIDRANEISKKVCNVIGPWDGDRLPRPNGNTARFTYLMSDGLYFGNGLISEFSKDPMGSAVLFSGAELINTLTDEAKKSA